MSSIVKTRRVDSLDELIDGNEAANADDKEEDWTKSRNGINVMHVLLLLQVIWVMI